MRESLYDYCQRLDMGRLLTEWDDATCTPEAVDHGSNRMIWWRCQKGHRWQAKISDRIRGVGCPYCTGRSVLTGVNDLSTLNPVLAKEWHPTKNGEISPEQVSCGSRRIVWWRCGSGHEWQAPVKKRSAGHGCPYCTGKLVVSGTNDLATLFPELASEWAEENGLLKPTDIGPYSHKKVWWRCGNGHTWQAIVYSRVWEQCGCPYCANRKVLSGFNDLRTKFPDIADQWYQDLNGELTPETVLAGSNRKAWWICPQGHVWEAVIASRTGRKKTGCPVCAGNISKKARQRYERILAGALDPNKP